MCQTLNNNIYAYSIEEVKKEANFKTVEEDGEPEDYDILIDAEDLITNEKTFLEKIKLKQKVILRIKRQRIKRITKKRRKKRNFKQLKILLEMHIEYFYI